MSVARLMNSERRYYSFYAIIYSVNNTRLEWKEMCEKSLGKAHINMNRKRNIMRDEFCWLQLFLFYKLFTKLERKTNLKRSFQWINTRYVKSFSFLHPTKIWFLPYSSYLHTTFLAGNEKNFLNQKICQIAVELLPAERVVPSKVSRKTNMIQLGSWRS